MFDSQSFINILKNKNYNLNIHYHKPLFTVEDSNKLRGNIEGAHSKNLFLKNKKNDFFLISTNENDKIDLKKISKKLGLGNISFAKEEHLSKYLGVRPGSVSPFSLLNDTYNSVIFYLEKKLYDSELLNFHPLINNMTITINTNNFIEFMIENNKKIHIFSSTTGEVYKTYE